MSKFFYWLIGISILFGCTKSDIQTVEKPDLYSKGINLIENPTFEYIQTCCSTALNYWYKAQTGGHISLDFTPVSPEDFSLKIKKDTIYYELANFKEGFYDFELSCDVKVVQSDTAWVGLHRIRGGKMYYLYEYQNRTSKQDTPIAPTTT
jgi:hypothetical protein